MQTLGYIWILDREGNEMQCVSVLFRRNKNFALLKRRNKSKHEGTHFINEQNYIQSLRFPQFSGLALDETYEAHYQEIIMGFLDNGETIYC